MPGAAFPTMETVFRSEKTPVGRRRGWFARRGVVHPVVGRCIIMMKRSGSFWRGSVEAIFARLLAFRQAAFAPPGVPRRAKKQRYQLELEPLEPKHAPGSILTHPALAP